MNAKKAAEHIWNATIGKKHGLKLRDGELASIDGLRGDNHCKQCGIEISSNSDFCGECMCEEDDL